jgi:hypothetical protein
LIQGDEVAAYLRQRFQRIRRGQLNAAFRKAIG